MNSLSPERPVAFSIDREAKLIVTTARGIVGCADILGHIHAKCQADVLSYAELFDAREIVLDLSTADLSLIAKEMRRVMSGRNPNKVAVLTNNGFIYGLARSYADMTKSDNPNFEVFNELDAARAWLAKPSSAAPSHA